MNVFQIHKEILDDYASYINSFIGIKDERINKTVTEKIESRKLWPEPLIQFNPSFESGRSVEQLISDEILHPEMGSVFKDYKLHHHQEDALLLGVDGKSFVVTSGTGSGKSLTYLGTIFNHLFTSQKSTGIKALIVYPMNALINSQFNEIAKFQLNYENNTGKPFPFTFSQYTGQEDMDAREKAQKNPPDILLTNYMMLELIMTRAAEQSIKDSIGTNLQYLVFDELHTYRGRQGADVSLLIRRIHALCKRPLVCIGTSATMASGTTIAEQKENVAKAAQTIFSQIFATEQIINERLIRSLSASQNNVSQAELREYILRDVELTELAAVTESPLAVWLESEIAIEEKEGVLVRKSPVSLSHIAAILSKHTGLKEHQTKTAVQKLLIQVNTINNSLNNNQKAVLPYKLNQFISQTGSIYITLDQPHDRHITLDAASYITDDTRGKKPLYPVVFSRTSGQEFVCVRKNISDGRLEPREFSQRILEEEDDTKLGYIVFDTPDDPLWSPESIEFLPDTWVKVSKNGSSSLKPEYTNRIPLKIWFNEYGDYSEKPSGLPFEAWFISAPLLFDPTSGVFHNSRASEGTKLTKLGTEGRSTATTVLSFAIIKAIHNAGLSPEIQKVLSFTDNRQDAALQAGHFNDFIKVGRLRSAIYNALSSSPEKNLDYSNIAQAVFNALKLEQAKYAKSPSPLSFMVKENEDALKKYIMYRILFDLKRGWRVILPNLEQCGLLHISYNHLSEVAESAEFWKDTEILNQMKPVEVENFLQQILDYFRRNYALKFSMLERDAIETNMNIIRERIKPEWGLDQNEKIDDPYYMRIDAMTRSRDRIYTASLGPSSYFGKYIKQTAAQYNIDVKGRYSEAVLPLLDKLAEAGYLYKTELNNGNSPIPLFQLKVENIIWKLHDGSSVIPDDIRQPSYKSVPPKINTYFQQFYRQNFSEMKDPEAREHTAQSSNEDRKERELRFRNGEISLLSCSPTMELGIDIATLNVVHLRNVPPNPANYAQRAGRAGRNGQGALIFTFCSNYSPHDQHYFNNPSQMVSGVVSPPRIDLLNEELLRSHLYAEFLSHTGLGALNDSLANLLVMEQVDSLPLKSEVMERLQSATHHKKEIASSFTLVISDIAEKLKETNWFNENWVMRQIDNAPEAFNKALNRWRHLFKAAIMQLNNAQTVINDPLLANESKEKRQAYYDQKSANQQLDALQNKSSFAGNQLSEFYPFRYLASEGFLPGYNFTRLPLRAFIPQGENGAYISRPRFLGIREFAPSNIVYHNGGKFKIHQLISSETETKIQKIKISPSVGYALMGAEYDLEMCPFSNSQMHNTDVKWIYNDLIPMAETKSMAVERINCEEEERLALGYEISTYFTVTGGLNRIKTVSIKDQEDELLKIRYIPAATLIKINEKLRSKSETGFLINTKTGFWKKSSDISAGDKDTENIKRVRLFTTDTADALYIHPMKALSFTEGKEEAAIITFQYALKRAIENYFQVESNEIGVEILGEQAWPNILIYEASQGSLGVLSQVVENFGTFSEIIKEAYRICYFEDGKDTKPEIGPASYADLLNYYNQRSHLLIDRHLIKDQLEKLLLCNFEILTNNNFENYEAQYQYLCTLMDKTSSTEEKFLQYLYRNNLKLPDRAQYEIPDMYIKPDFYYEKENACIFCDGTPHDLPDVKQDDKKKREALLNKGYDVFVYYYKDNLADIIAGRSDIFVKVR